MKNIDKNRFWLVVVFAAGALLFAQAAMAAPVAFTYTNNGVTPDCRDNGDCCCTATASAYGAGGLHPSPELVKVHPYDYGQPLCYCDLAGGFSPLCPDAGMTRELCDIGCGSCPHDSNDDGEVVTVDLLHLLGCWGATDQDVDWVSRGCQCHDINQDGVINVVDHLDLLATPDCCPGNDDDDDGVCNDADLYPNCDDTLEWDGDGVAACIDECFGQDDTVDADGDGVKDCMEPFGTEVENVIYLYAHPDDDVMFGANLMAYLCDQSDPAALGLDCNLTWLTAGENSGQCQFYDWTSGADFAEEFDCSGDPCQGCTNNGSTTVGNVRTAEAQHVAAMLGLSSSVLFSQALVGGNLVKAEHTLNDMANVNGTTVANMIATVKNHIIANSPGGSISNVHKTAILTHDPILGDYCHSDHRVAGYLIVRAVEEIGQANGGVIPKLFFNRTWGMDGAVKRSTCARDVQMFKPPASFDMFRCDVYREYRSQNMTVESDTWEACRDDTLANPVGQMVWFEAYENWHPADPAYIGVGGEHNQSDTMSDCPSFGASASTTLVDLLENSYGTAPDICELTWPCMGLVVDTATDICPPFSITGGGSAYWSDVEPGEVCCILP